MIIFTVSCKPKQYNTIPVYDFRFENLTKQDIEQSQYVFNLWYKNIEESVIDTSRYHTELEYKTLNNRLVDLKLNNRYHIDMNFKINIISNNTHVISRIEEYFKTQYFLENLFCIVKNVKHKYFVPNRDLKDLNRFISLYIYYSLRNTFGDKIKISHYTKEPLKIMKI